jgi:3-deoxy-manno-octulosonate cytidylyltransferase (CMP-KDO synthetase)
MKILGIIPARFGSTRFPGKPLADIFGKPMILRVVEQAEKASSLSDVVVATDDERIASVVRAAGKNVVMTSSDHPSGTDRCLEALTAWGREVDAVINIQGDEPYVKPEQIDQLAELIGREESDIATLCVKIEDVSWLIDPNKVKLVADDQGSAMYFSRQAIPFVKDLPMEQWLSAHAYFKHLGLYAYKSGVLKNICALPVSSMEKAESLEQLRWLQHGLRIKVGVTHWETPAIDTPADLEKLLKSGLA